MIPRKLHYIWLPDEQSMPLDANTKFCMRTWKKYAKHYNIRGWSMQDFDLTKMPEWVMEAVQQKKWAFASDYLRLYVLNMEGGFYLDTDVVMMDSPDRFRKHRFVSAVEYYPDLFFNEGKNLVDKSGRTDAIRVPGMAVLSAIMGSETHHPYVRKCMEFYETNHFVLPDGSLNNMIIAPHIYADVAKSFGFLYKNEYQKLDHDVVLYPSEVLAPGYRESTDRSAMIHLCTGSWKDMSVAERRQISRDKRRQRWKLVLKNRIIKPM